MMKELKKALYYLYVSELRGICGKQLKISDKGTKDLLAQRILKYLDSEGKVVLTKPEVPEASKASGYPKDKGEPTKLSNLMLHGSYKNGYETRAFFKKHIGSSSGTFRRFSAVVGRDCSSSSTLVEHYDS